MEKSKKLDLNTDLGFAERLGEDLILGNFLLQNDSAGESKIGDDTLVGLYWALL